MLAAYGLADAEGLLCSAGQAAIAGHVGVDRETAGRYLRLLEEEGVLAARGGGPGRPTLLVLLDHHGSRELLARLDGRAAPALPGGRLRGASR